MILQVRDGLLLFWASEGSPRFRCLLTTELLMVSSHCVLCSVPNACASRSTGKELAMQASFLSDLRPFVWNLGEKKT